MLNAKRLRERRTSQGLSQEGLAKAIGVDRHYIWKLETGMHKDVRGSTLVKLADALDCTTDYLLGRQRKVAA
jgi:transcriptional regulator with XRE-family HTH domain